MKHIITKEDLKDFLKTHKTLIRYTRDNKGFKNGVVVAIGADRIGYSKVHGDDYKFKSSIKSIPHFEKFCQHFITSEPPLDLLADFYIAMQAINSVDRITCFEPDFDRFTSLKIAINRAISGKPLEIPYSMQDTVDDIYVRSVIYFK